MRKDPILDEEKRSYGALWLVSSLLLLVGAFWAVADDNIFRRPWKKWQAEFNRLEIRRLQQSIADEQARLDADPAYQEAVKRLEEARTSLASGEGARRLRELEGKLAAAKKVDLEKDLELRFVKSELEEWRYFFDEAAHHHRPTEEIQRGLEQREALKREREQAFAASQAQVAAIESEIKGLQDAARQAEETLAELTAPRTEIEERLANISLGYLPGPKATPPFIGWDWQPKIPKIQQVVLEEFDRNNFDEPVARVDRCTSCHAGINKAGFDEEPHPWKTHPRRELFLGRHPTEKFGCTPCHSGQGPAVNSDRQAHGNFWVEEHGERLLENIEFMDRPMNRGEKVESLCIRCHAGVQHLDGAQTIGRGELLFQELGCHGCHLTEGYEELAKADGVPTIAPSLRRIGAKADPAWLVRWVKSPHEFRPRTRMPNFLFDDDQAVAIAAYLLSTTREPSAEWLAAHPAPAGLGDAERGRELVDAVGCRACHGFADGDQAGQLGVNKDIAPNLARIAEKTDPRWLYHWVKNPRGYSPIARMPNLRLSDEDARAVTAYLATLGAKQPGAADLQARLGAAENVEAGEKLVRKYGCAGCHDIPGMENESRIGVELSTFGSKTREELFFGDRTDLHETWDVWTFHKLKDPRIYATRWIEQLMPQFDLADEDVLALRAFLASRIEGKMPARFVHRPRGQETILAGRRLVARYNCTGCHVIEGRGGDIRRLYEAQPTLAPPILTGQGEKVQADWLFDFLKAPVPIRPWLQVRMPTFGLSDTEANALVQYFLALDQVEVPFVYIEPAAFSPESIEAGRLLASDEYWNCFSCHQRGAEKPGGSPEDWAPDLTMAYRRLSPSWIVKWLHDPQKMMPGTRMPSFYPDPEAQEGPPDILGGDDEVQVLALRDYVISLGMPHAPSSPTRAAGVTTAGPGATQ